MMELVHRFSVPVPVEDAWAHFNDISSVAECFPGATVSSSDDEGFVGSVKVKLGPIALLYNGAGSFVEKDHGSHRMRIEAKGKDKRGNGTAAAQVLLTMAGGGTADSTDVEVTTELSVTGKPAQFGRGVMQDVSDKLLAQFVSCLEQRYADSEGADAGADAGPGSADAAAAAAAPAVAPGMTGTATASPAAAAEASRPPADGRSPGRSPSPAPTSDAIDLGRTVLPVLARSYGPWAVAALAVLVAVRCCRRR